MISLVGVGHCCYDFLCSIESYPQEDSSTWITEIQNQGGGAVATAMVAAARLGISTGMICNLGDDDTGLLIEEEFKKEHVDVSAVSRLKGMRSLSSYVMVNTEHGTRTKFPMRDRMPPIEWNAHQKEMLKKAKILHLDGTNYQNAYSAAELAREYGVLISLDGCSRQPDNRLNRGLASMADILIMNAVYPMAVSQRSCVHDALLDISIWGPKIVMSTAGANGVYAVLEGRVYHYPPCKAKIVDTTGAGDVFHGAFLAAYLNGKNQDECTRFAQYTAALKCGQFGGRQGIPDWDTVEQNYMTIAGPACESKSTRPKE